MPSSEQTLHMLQHCKLQIGKCTQLKNVVKNNYAGDIGGALQYFLYKEYHLLGYDTVWLL
jgi:hypothetical protein